MFDVFLSDNYLFTTEISFLITTKDKSNILNIIYDKHQDELSNHKSISTKKNDLIIWNAVLTREIINSGISKRYLHPSYNKFYKTILMTSDLKSLQRLEMSMIEYYFDMVTNHIEKNYNYIVNKIIGYLYFHIESPVSLHEISKDLNLSIGYISNCFKKNMGISVMNYAKKIKVDRAKTLLLNTNKSILDISIILGFCDQSHFSKTFKKITGLSPMEYRSKN